MTELVTRPGAWLLQQAPTFPDTVVMQAATASPEWIAVVGVITNIVTTLTLVALLAVLGPAAWSARRTLRRTRELLDRANVELTPLARQATRIADNVEYVTSSIRSDVEQVNATIAAANRRLQQAVDVTETRLNEFNALLHVVQQEAEQAFVSTAAAVRGVRTGAATFSLGADAMGGEDTDGNDSESESAAERREVGGGGAQGDAPARPRLQSRRKRRP